MTVPLNYWGVAHGMTAYGGSYLVEVDPLFNQAPPSKQPVKMVGVFMGPPIIGNPIAVPKGHRLL